MVDLEWTRISERELGGSVPRLRAQGASVFFLRGSKMRTVPRLMDHFAAALQFPWYFGENWPALDECLCDMDWLPFGTSMLLVIDAASSVLDRESSEQLGVLVEVFENAVREFSQAISGTSWDRPAIPFNVVLQFEEDDMQGLDRWRKAGANFGPEAWHTSA